MAWEFFGTLLDLNLNFQTPRKVTHHQNKLICCTTQVWDPAILTMHQNTIENIPENECSWFKTVSIHLRKVWTTETEGKTASKTPSKCPL